MRMTYALLFPLGSFLAVYTLAGAAKEKANRPPSSPIVATNAVTLVIERNGARIGISFDETAKKPNWPISIQVQVNDTTKVYKP